MVERLDAAARAAALAELHDWTLEPAGDAIFRRLEFLDFAEAFSVMTRIAFVAERLDHHPEWSNVHREVRIRLTTHDASGLSHRDFIMAREIDAICRDR